MFVLPTSIHCTTYTGNLYSALHTTFPKVQCTVNICRSTRIAICGPACPADICYPGNCRRIWRGGGCRLRANTQVFRMCPAVDTCIESDVYVCVVRSCKRCTETKRIRSLVYTWSVDCRVTQHRKVFQGANLYLWNPMEIMLRLAT